MDILANKRFNDWVINDIIENTYRENRTPFHWYLFKCNISVMLSHEFAGEYDKRPYFVAAPDCFRKIMDSHYGLTDYESELMWRWYGNYIIDRYMEATYG